MKRLLLSRTHHNAVAVVHVHEVINFQQLVVSGERVRELGKPIPRHLLNVLEHGYFVTDADWAHILDLVAVGRRQEHELLVACVKEPEEGEHVARLHVFREDRHVFGVGGRDLELARGGVVEVFELHHEVRVIARQRRAEDRVVVDEVLVDGEAVVDEVPSVTLATVAIKDLLASGNSSISDHRVALALVVVLPVGLLLGDVVEHISVRDQRRCLLSMDVEPEYARDYRQTAPDELEEHVLAEGGALGAYAVVLGAEALHAVGCHSERV
mmetsp:Transcript_1435/g.2462  ORF Transcript_1435/g.2462 Transcript_1435/m.2462 type:complete len:269 (+) Transcript_1435:472-1278(+)